MTRLVIGFVIALAVGLTGIGGGSFTVPALLLFAGLSAGEAVGTAFVFAGVVRLVAAPFYLFNRQEHNIYVNGISPGAILTDTNRAHLTDPARHEKLLENIPVKRIGCPEDIVGEAIFLASAESDYVTGTTIYVDGGLLLS